MRIWDLIGGLLKFGWVERTPTPPARDDEALTPHCDVAILHAHGVCRYCDQFPRRQAGRVAQRINFTGQYDPAKAKCPSEHHRSPEARDAWAGNQPEEYA